MSDTRIFLDAMAGEELRQIQLWGGKSHDDQHGQFDWCRFIVQQAAKASTDICSPGEFRDRMVKIAALAASAWKSSQRKS